MKLIRKIIEIIGRTWSHICPMSIYEKIEMIRKVIYTSYLRRFFMSLGEESFLEYKASLLVGLRYISIGDRCLLNKGILLTAWDDYYGTKFHPRIAIGNGTNIGADSHITAINSVSIGNNVLTGPNVFISDHSHGDTVEDDIKIPPIERDLISKGAVVIEDNVWIGRCAAIMPGVTIGRNTIIGANSVVTHDIPPFSVAAGIPAKVIKTISN